MSYAQTDAAAVLLDGYDLSHWVSIKDPYTNESTEVLLDEYNGSSYNWTSNPSDDYIFDQVYIRTIFITLYTIVFCLCFFGNLLVILVVTLSRRLRSITNFFLANLAVADFCVGIFCVYQNLLIYITSDWILGDFLCKMYHFITSLSYTASIFILVVICTERYFAIIYPITCKQILTPKRLRFVILAVWVKSAIYSVPKIVWCTTTEHNIDGQTQTFCAPDRRKFNSELFDMINFVLLYVIPLAIMTLLYTRIAVRLWRSSRQLEKQMNACINSGNSNHCHSQGLHRTHSTRYKHQIEAASNGVNGDTAAAAAGSLAPTNVVQSQPQPTTPMLPNPNSSLNVLKARRGVIRMLIIVVLTFAVCNLPLHARKMWQYWSKDYQGDSTFSALFTPLTFLVTYFNSAINPLLYAFLSKNFRRGMREILLCSLVGGGAAGGGLVLGGGNRRQASSTRNQYMMGGLVHKNGGSGGINRFASTRSTLKNNATTVTILNNDLEHSSTNCSHEM